MKSWVKIILVVFGAVLFVWIAAIILFRFYLTERRVLSWIRPPLQQRLQREVNIAGARAGLSGIYLEQVVVEARRGGEPPLASVAAVAVHWRLLPLLWGRLELSAVDLLEPEVHVVRRPDGTLSVDDLLQQAAGQQERGARQPGSASRRFPVLVELLTAHQGKIIIEDRARQPQLTYLLDRVELRLTGLSQPPLTYSLTGRYPVSERSRLTLEGSAEPAAGKADLRLQLADLDLVRLNPLLGSEIGFASGVLGLRLHLLLHGEQRAELQASLEVAELGLVSSQGIGASAPAALQLSAEVDIPARTAKLERAELMAAGQRLNMNGALLHLRGKPRFEGKVTSASLELDPLAGLLPPAGKPAGRRGESGFTAAGELRVEKLSVLGLQVQGCTARFSLDRGVLRVRPIRGSFSDGRLNGSLRVEPGQPGPPYELQATVTGAQLGELLAGAGGTRTSGTFAARLVASGLADRWDALPSLQASLRLDARDGRLAGHPLVQELARLLQLQELEKVSYFDLMAEARAAGAELEVDALKLRGPQLRIEGDGRVDLAGRKLDLALTVGVPVKLAVRLAGQPKLRRSLRWGKSWAELPIVLQGTPGEPVYQVGTRAATGTGAR